MIYTPDKMEQLRKDYRRVLPTVWADLAELCFANAPTNGPREEGRRDVWLHINRFLNLEPNQIVEMFAGHGIYYKTEE